jgi:hypothetical protein
VRETKRPELVTGSAGDWHNRPNKRQRFAVFSNAFQCS